MDLSEKILRREEVFRGILVNVEHWDVELPDGKQAAREIIHHIGAAAVVPVDEDNHVYLVEQWRSPFGRTLLELPAGKLDFAEEEGLACAQRELAEETGFTADSWTKLTTMIPTPAYLTEIVHIYMARGLHAGERHLDEGEFIQVHRLPMTEALALVQSGKINNATAITGLCMAARELGL